MMYEMDERGKLEEREEKKEECIGAQGAVKGAGVKTYAHSFIIRVFF